MANNKDELTNMRLIWQDFFEKLTEGMSKERKQYLQTKEGRLKFMDWYFESDHDEYPWAFFEQEEKGE